MKLLISIANVVTDIGILRTATSILASNFYFAQQSVGRKMKDATAAPGG